MPLTTRLAALLSQERARLILGAAAAFLWFALILAAEAGRSSVLPWVYGIPACLVLVWWRVRPWLALGLSSGALLIVLMGNVNGDAVNGGGLAACLTSFFAIVGASASKDRGLQVAGAALAGVESLLSLGGAGIIGFLLAAVLGTAALVGGWAWREFLQRQLLQGRLVETEQRSETAERDVLLELERNRIAREVHDVVAHSLAVVIAQADGARFAAEAKPESVAPALEAISDTARRALGEVRTMLHDLRTSGEGGVVPGPEDLAGLVGGIRALGVEVDEVTYGEAQPLDERTGLAMYRIAQEALTNAMRHGDRALPVGFELDWGEREVVLVVTNAVPSDAVPATERSGHGVTGMRERAVDAGGDCSAGTGSNGRFRVRVALPIPQPTAQPEPEPTHATPLAALLAPLAAPRG